MERTANWILHNIPDVTNKKLQKLMYYAYAWYLVLFNEDENDLENRLFSNSFQAWVHGPVIPELYQMLKEYQGDVIPVDVFDKHNYKKFNADELDLLNQIKEVYGNYNGNQLESITHQETPWKNARGNCGAYDICKNKISDKDIFCYYSQRLE